MISKPELLIGSRLKPKNSSVYFFAALSWNAYLHKESTEQVAAAKELKFDNWPGVSLGLMVH